MKQCGQEGCKSKQATHKMYWPGSKPTYICEDHIPQAKAIAKVLGFHLTIERLGSVVE